MDARPNSPRMTGDPSLDGPVVPEVGIIAAVPDRWGTQWQPRHQVMSRLANYFHVVWVNPAPDWRDVLDAPNRYDVADARPYQGFEVHSPDRTLPRFYRPAAVADWTRRRRYEGARSLLLARGCKKILLYVWRPKFADLLTTLAHDGCCYHIDDEYTFAKRDAPIPENERRLLEQADQVIIHSPALLEKKGEINPRTAFVPNGVDFDAHAEPCREPEDLRDIPRPRIGYVGWLKNQLDWDLLEALVERHPEWNFVFAGSTRHPELESRIERLGKRPNAHMLGAKSSEALTRYPQHFDVCLMPYRDNDYTRFIYPLKLHEYLAGGAPTVGTPIRSLEAFDSVVELARDPDEWSAAIARSLDNRSAEQRRERRAVAREHDWNVLVQRIAKLLGETLDPAYAQRIEAAGIRRQF